MSIEPQIISSKKETKPSFYPRQKEQEILDLDAHKLWLDNYNGSCQTDNIENAWRKKYIIENGYIVSCTK